MLIAEKVRTSIKNFKEAQAGGKDKETVTKLFSEAQSLVAKASAKGLFHKNKASRTISKLAAALEGKKAGEEAKPGK